MNICLKAVRDLFITYYKQITNSVISGNNIWNEILLENRLVSNSNEAEVSGDFSLMKVAGILLPYSIRLR